MACLSVIAYHVNYFTQKSHLWNASTIGPFTASIAMVGWSGVTLFFVLSGFLLFMPYAKALLFDSQWPSLRLFYTRRALRILPGYYVALFLLIFLAHPDYLQPDHFKQLGLFLTFFMDSSAKTYQQIDGPFWTLAVEWQYYLLLPFLALGFRLLAQHGSQKKRISILILCLVGMIVWGVTTRSIGKYYSDHPAQLALMPQPVFGRILFFLYGMSGKYLEDFAIGMLVSMLYVYTKNVPEEHPLARILRGSSMWQWRAGTLLLVFMASWSIFPPLLFALDAFIGPHNWLAELGFALGYGLCLSALLFGPQELQRLFSWPLLRQIGFMSYSLYIWHVPILLAFMLYVLPHIHFLSNTAVYSVYWLCVICCIIPFSYLFYRCIERPWIQLANKTRHKEGTQ